MNPLYKDHNSFGPQENESLEDILSQQIEVLLDIFTKTKNHEIQRRILSKIEGLEAVQEYFMSNGREMYLYYKNKINDLRTARDMEFISELKSQWTDLIRSIENEFLT